MQKELVNLERGKNLPKFKSGVINSIKIFRSEKSQRECEFLKFRSGLPKGACSPFSTL